MKNKLTDLNDHLFAQVERLGDESLKGKDLKDEIQRSAAISNVSKQIIANAQLVLDAKVAVQEHQLTSNIPMLENNKND